MLSATNERLHDGDSCRARATVSASILHVVPAFRLFVCLCLSAGPTDARDLGAARRWVANDSCVVLVAWSPEAAKHKPNETGSIVAFGGSVPKPLCERNGDAIPGGRLRWVSTVTGGERQEGWGRYFPRGHSQPLCGTTASLSCTPRLSSKAFWGACPGGRLRWVSTASC